MKQLSETLQRVLTLEGKLFRALRNSNDEGAANILPLTLHKTNLQNSLEVNSKITPDPLLEIKLKVEIPEGKNGVTNRSPEESETNKSKPILRINTDVPSSLHTVPATGDSSDSYVVSTPPSTSTPASRSLSPFSEMGTQVQSPQ
jgi:hypothetical protein